MKVLCNLMQPGQAQMQRRQPGAMLQALARARTVAAQLRRKAHLPSRRLDLLGLMLVLQLTRPRQAAAHEHRSLAVAQLRRMRQ